MRAPDTYEWYRDRLERFGQTYPDLKVGDLRPFHVQEWMDGMDVSSGTKRNYGRSIKRSLRWAKKQGYIDSNPTAHHARVNACCAAPIVRVARVGGRALGSQPRIDVLG